MNPAYRDETLVVSVDPDIWVSAPMNPAYRDETESSEVHKGPPFLSTNESRLSG